MKRLMIALCAAALPLAAGGCAAGYGYGGAGYYAAGPYAYDGYYDDFYGPIYDGYWGDDGFFYYRGSVNDHRFRRGDAAHFSRNQPAGAGHFHSFSGTMTPGQGMRTPHFAGGGAGRVGGGGRGGRR